MIYIPGRTPLEVMSMSPATRLAYAKLQMQLASWSLGLTAAPTEVVEKLSWDDAIATVLHLGADPEELDDAAASFCNDCFWVGGTARLEAGSTLR